jgi:hypothetical protein
MSLVHGGRSEMDEKKISPGHFRGEGEITMEKNPKNHAAKAGDASKKTTPKEHPNAAVSGRATHAVEKKAAPVEKTSKLSAQKFASEVATSIDQLNETDELRQKTGAQKPGSHITLPVSQTGR